MTIEEIKREITKVDAQMNTKWESHLVFKLHELRSQLARAQGQAAKRPIPVWPGMSRIS